MTSLIDCGLESKFNLFNIALMLRGSLILTIQEEDDNDIISIHKRRRFPILFFGTTHAFVRSHSQTHETCKTKKEIFHIKKNYD